MQNWVLLTPVTGPMPDTAVRHFWSLSVEEQFYLAWPLLVIAGAALATVCDGDPARAVRRREHPRRRMLAYWIAASAADYQLAYFSTFSRAWEFAAGGALALLPGLAVRGRRADVLFWAGLAALVASIIGVRRQPRRLGIDRRDDPRSLSPAMGRFRRVRRWVVGWRPVQFTGDISYALYLWHWPVLLFAPYITGVPSETWFMVLLLAFAVVLSWATTHFVENPIRRTPLDSRQFRPQRDSRAPPSARGSCSRSASPPWAAGLIRPRMPRRWRVSSEACSASPPPPPSTS